MGTTRDWLLFLHITAAVVAFTPVLAHALLLRHVTAKGGDGAARLTALAARHNQLIYGPALVVAGLFGLALVVEGHWEMTQSWILSALGLWLLMGAALFGLVIPGERGTAAGDPGAARRARLGGAALALLFVSMLHLMVFKPGWP